MTFLSFAVRTTRAQRGFGVLLLAFLLSVVSPANPAAWAQQDDDGLRQTFLPDDPITLDPDRLDMPAPASVEPSDVGDYVMNTFSSPADYEGPARNANTMEEVPRSSWYNWRHYFDRMSLADLRRGPDPADSTLAGPAAGTWTVVSTKEEGKSIGMQIKDERGDRYFMKFDPPGYLGLASGAEVVATKLFYALGYNVPQNYVVDFDTERLVLSDEVNLDRTGLRELLEKAAQHADGRVRALASKFLGGKPIGPFQYYGTRPDDGNDVFPHESRRELRGMRVFAAWLNHVDARGINSLDMVVDDVSPSTGDSATYVRHSLIDFGTTLGGGPLGPKDRWQGYEYGLEPGRIAVRALSLGFRGAPWLSIEYPGYPSIGHIEAAHFDPQTWKPLYPNPAFRQMDAADAFWAARQVMHFTDEELRAIVGTGRYPTAEAGRYLAETLMQRRDRIGRAYLGFGGGIDRFRVESGALAFDDLLARHGFAPADRRREVTWRVFNNGTGRPGRVIEECTSARESFSLPSGATARFLLAEIETLGAGTPARTRAYLRRTGAGSYEMVGLHRDGAARIEATPAPATATASDDVPAEPVTSGGR